jgi:hypothetical protein
MAKRQQQQGIGSPGVKVGGGIGPALNPISLTRPERMPHGNYLDPHVAAEQIGHPSAKWAGVELDPIRPRK